MQTEVNWERLTNPGPFGPITLLFLAYLGFAVVFAAGVLVRAWMVIGVRSAKIWQGLEKAVEALGGGRLKDAVTALDNIPPSSPEAAFGKALASSVGKTEQAYLQNLRAADLEFHHSITLLRGKVEFLSGVFWFTILVSFAVVALDPFHIYGSLSTVTQPGLKDALPALRQTAVLLNPAIFTLAIVYAVRTYVAARLSARETYWLTCKGRAEVVVPPRLPTNG